jgi:NADPH-dependent curcumin reductase CurA
MGDVNPTGDVNRQVVLVKRPIGMVTESCFEVRDAEIPEPADGEVLIKVTHLAIDPAIRGWLNEGGNYLPGVGIGEPVRSNGGGIVVASRNEQVEVGSIAFALTGWQQYCTAEFGGFDIFRQATILPPGTDIVAMLALYGQVATTAWVGINKVLEPSEGEIVCVSAAASGVGSIAGQLAKLRGATVIGIAGSAEKCRWVVDDLGFDACIDYKAEDVAARLKEIAPRGVNAFFDNVGGEILDTVLRRLALHARVALCGSVSTDNATEPYRLRNYTRLMGKRARLEGFNTADHWDSYEQATREVAELVSVGRLQYRAHFLRGIERAPEGLVRLFTGDHLGKIIIEV